MFQIDTALPRPALDVINSVAAEYLDALFGVIETEYGSMDAYLDAAGIDAALRDTLRERLLEPARSS